MTETKAPGRFRKTVTRALAVIGGITVASFILLVLVPLFFAAGPGVPSRTILELDLTGGIAEYTPADPIAMLLGGDRLTVRDVVDALERAESDDRVRALVARVGGADLSFPQAEEVREAVLRFRDSGKRAVAFAESFGEFGGGNAAYYLASAFDEIQLQPSGDVGLTGLAAETPFFAGTLEMVGVEPQLSNRYEYKDAVNVLTETSMTEPQREATSRLVGSVFENFVAGVAGGRGLPVDVVTDLIHAGPYYGTEALNARLVDGLAYRDEVFDRLREEVGGGDFLFVRHYLSRAGRPNRRGPQIALIHGVGAVRTGASQVDPLAGGTVMGAETITRAFRDAVDADGVRAIVFRIDSPGGSYVASDAIWRETIRARAAGKPVIVSMGSVAGSGGYFVAMGADRIVAHPSTVTGSIGVYGGKLVLGGLSERLGVTWDAVRTADNADMWSPVEEFSPSEWERVEASLDRIYQDFTAKVASGRGLSRDSVHVIARGRIWSGADALRIGLVDELGGLRTAMRLAREAAGLEPDEPVTVREFPRERSLVEILLEPERSSSYPTIVGALVAAVEDADRLMRRLGLRDLFGRPGGAVSMPGVPQVR